MNRQVEDPSLYINREASWLAFNGRVLEEANDERNPVLERVKFLAITASNLDEFFEVRVAGLLLRRKRRATGSYIGVITVPRVLPRLVRVPSKSGTHYIFLADLLTHHAARMYRGYEIASVASFRVTRNSNLYLEEEESRNLLESVRTELHRRRKGDAVRLEIDADAHAEIAERLQQTFELENWQVFHTQGPVNLSRLFNFYELTERPDLKFKPFVARELRLPTTSRNIFAELRKRDILLHHPFDSFDAVVDLIESAANDPSVISV